VGRNRHAQRAARHTWEDAERLPLLGLVLLAVVAGVLSLLPAWLGALMGVPLD
jgi:hypothetical protein